MAASPSHIALELLARLAEDRLRGEVRPLAHYLALYPGHEESVAEEYLRATAEGEPDAPSASTDPNGVQRLGPYRLVEELGRGGQAVVWLAEDERLERRVALKVVPRSPGAAELSPRFLREARATAGLDHPNLCVLYDTGVDEACAWIAMQYVEGRPLGEWLAERDLGNGAPPSAADVQIVLACFEKSARALHVAHERGIVHRDIKPANIMVAADGEPVVLDFGVALLEDEGPTLTLTGDSLGTPAYMSPEQVGAGQAPVTRQTDVWALGVSLYECCTGRRPFDGATTGALAGAILREEPVDARRLSPHLGEDLGAVIETALSKELSGRYRTALELADDLGRVRRNEPTAARPLTRVARLARWSQRNPLVAGLGGSLLVLLVAGTALTLVKNRQLAAGNRSLVRKTEEADRNAERARSEADAKAAALAEYERMADAQRLSDARAEERELYPVHPDLVPALEAWLAEHAGLFARLASHEAALARMRASAAPYAEAARRRDHAQELDRLERIRSSLPYMKEELRAGLEEEAAELESRTREQLTWDFGADVDAQFRHDALARLATELREFIDPETGTVARVRERLELSRRVAEESVDRHAAAWRAARERVRSSPLYAGLELPVQVGLVPLGPDADSGLEEFLLWESQPDGLPERGVDGRFVIDGSAGIVLVLIPPGSFLMGAQSSNPDGPNYDPEADFYEGPLTEVTLDAYFIGKYEVTQAQWFRATHTKPSAYYEGFVSRGLARPVDLRHPVEQVSWDDCQEALRQLGLVLPTEAQWERAARGGEDTIYAGTSDPLELALFANIAGTETRGYFLNRSETHTDDFVVHAPVGSFEPNLFGLHDMTGNVWEWCRDHFASYQVTPAPGDGERSSFLETRMYRGGSAGNREADERVAKRTETNGDIRFNGLGVRVARRLRR